MPGWTDDALDRLRQLFKDGLSGSQIAEALGRTRNAVIGKAHRLGLYRPPISDEQKRKKASIRARKKDAIVNRIMNKPKTKKTKKKIAVSGNGREGSTLFEEIELNEPMSELDPADIPLAQRKTFFQLKEHHCRFPYGDVGDPDFFFCGGDKESGYPYCRDHCRVALRPPPRPNRYAFTNEKKARAA